IKIDSLAPSTTDSLAGTLGSNGWYTSNSVNVTLTAADATSGISQTYYIVDGGSATLYSGAFAVSGESGHRLTCYTVNNAGTPQRADTALFPYTTHFRSIKIDSLAPSTTDSLAGILGSNAWYTSNSVNVTLTASDDASGVSQTYYIVDGGGATLYSGAFAVSGDGSHSITFYSVDNAGNMEGNRSDSFRIDSVAPTTTDSLAGTVGSNGWHSSRSVNVTL